MFQSYYDLHPASSKFLWWKRKKEKFDAIQHENDRLSLEQCLMTMILNVDLLCRVRRRLVLIKLPSDIVLSQVPSGLTDELSLPSPKKTKRLDDLIRNACNGDFQMKKYISKDCERFLQVTIDVFSSARCTHAVLSVWPRRNSSMSRAMSTARVSRCSSHRRARRLTRTRPVHRRGNARSTSQTWM